jgi:hypothetical protein
MRSVCQSNTLIIGEKLQNAAFNVLRQDAEGNIGDRMGLETHQPGICSGRQTNQDPKILLE